MSLSPDLLIAAAGLLLGSFLNVVIHRIPLRQSLWFPASHCPHCGSPIRWYHNIPLWGYAILGGRCGSCRQKISIRYPAVELATALCLVFLHSQFGWTILFFKSAYLTFLMIVLSEIDYRSHIIPNRLLLISLPIGVGFLILEGVSSLVAGMAGMVMGGAIMTGIALVGRRVYKRDAMGGGDIKLTALLGLFLGWKLLAMVLFLTFLFISVAGWIGVLFRKLDRRAEIPMAPFFAMAMMGSLLFGADLIQWYLDNVVNR